MHRSLAAATLAGLVLAGAACADPAASTQPSVTAPAATTAPVTSEPTTTATAPVVSDTAAVPPHGEPSPTGEAPPAALLQTFTFPDGHISFAYPAGWSIRTEQGPYLAEEAKAGSVYAIVSDGSGAEVARVLSGMYGDGAAGPVKRTVLERVPLPGITAVAGEPVEFGFAMDQGLIVPSPYTAEPTLPTDGSLRYYLMGVRDAGEFLPTQNSSGSNQVSLPNGVMSAFVVFGQQEKQPVFASLDAAKAWMATEQYAQLKALLLSLNYL